MITAAALRNARILIVDDEIHNVDVLRRVLEREGFTRIESTTDSRKAARRADSGFCRKSFPSRKRQSKTA